MRRIALDLRRMHDSGRLLLYEAIGQKSHAKQNERYAEELSHVQQHILLKANLRLLYEFNKETHSE